MCKTTQTEVPETSICPDCGGNLGIRHSKTTETTFFIGCSNYKKGCTFIAWIPFAAVVLWVQKFADTPKVINWFSQFTNRNEW